MFEFIAHDKGCSKPDEVDRDVRHGQVTQDHDDDDDVCMYQIDRDVRDGQLLKMKKKMYVCMSEAASTIICGHRLYWLIGGL